MKGVPYESKLEELGLWTVEERRNRSDLIEVYEMTTGLSGLWLENFFKLNNPGITRTITLEMTRQRSSSEMRQHFFSNRVVTAWSRLDDCIVTAPSLNTFKAGLSKLKKMTGLFHDWWWAPEVDTGWRHVFRHAAFKGWSLNLVSKGQSPITHNCLGQRSFLAT